MLDYQVFQWINDLAGKGTFLNPIMRFFAEDAQYFLFLGILVYWFTRTRDHRIMVAEALISAAVGLGISGLIGDFFYRDRPFITHSVHQLIQHAANASFPSDHATAAFAIAMAFFLGRRREGKLWLVFAGLIAFSRVWTGVHYPTDVMAGAGLGILSACGIHMLLTRWALVHKFIGLCIDVYEKAEHKVLPKKRSQLD
ncbi:phosphatase PAP2 family protein [Paenibacillus selenitireducens]|jgi:undecaprenyl-diphosphatase|uniref:Phosphatase PAP2 family protein n=1 Tax=Paenibacillus selenitireducens TaxID=1324314 RepID=A0A1T2XDB9_9BACL|nr:undecaprenyl-diphosphatase [Paenibacillus selenitireducens]OPA77676.1 phosphatase PAP2 family protein [Paenibacillus selenitireducens]